MGSFVFGGDYEIEDTEDCESDLVAVGVSREDEVGLRFGGETTEFVEDFLGSFECRGGWICGKIWLRFLIFLANFVPCENSWQDFIFFR